MAVATPPGHRHTLRFVGPRADTPALISASEAEEIWRTGRLADLPRRLREVLAPETRVRELETGEIVHWDRPILGRVLTGCLCIFMARRGRRAALRYVPEGEMFGLPTVIAPDIAANAGLELLIRAVEPTKIAQLPAERLSRILPTDAEAAYTVSRWMVEDMVAGHTVLADDVFLPVRQLLARHMLDLATRDEDVTRVNATQEQLADAIGSVRAVVARALGELRQMDVIGRDSRGLVITDLAGLHEIARGERRPTR
jgi:CRP/FNR family cyclic AMP-dependent transcriptional regulator